MSIQTLITVLSCSIFAHQNSKTIAKKQEWALRILYNDFSGDYEPILNKSGKSTMKVNRLRTLALEVFKTLNNMNLEYMKEIFHKTPLSTHRPLNLQVSE